MTGRPLRLRRSSPALVRSDGRRDPSVAIHAYSDASSSAILGSAVSVHASLSDHTAAPWPASRRRMASVASMPSPGHRSSSSWSAVSCSILETWHQIAHVVLDPE